MTTCYVGQLHYFIYLCTYQCQAPPTPGQAEVGIVGDLQMRECKFPTPGDNFELRIPY